jgi:hypothetical protein
MDRRAIGSSLLALAFGPVALGAIALGAATAASGPASIAASVASSGTHDSHEGARDAAADEVSEAAVERSVGGSVTAFEARVAPAAITVEYALRASPGDAAPILSFAPKTSPPA